MSGTITAWWIPLTSAIAGGVLSLIGGVVTIWISTAHQSRQRRDENQLETLQNLQDDLLQIYRGSANKENYTLEWRRSIILIVRVHDDGVRRIVEEFKESVSNKNEKEKVEQLFKEVNKRIGDIIRTI